jgi:uncharacterized protein (DUF1778 family)
MTQKAYQIKTIRLHPAEERIIEKACAALNDLDRTTLMTDAAVFHAIRLGIYYGADAPPPLKSSWPYVPERGDEATSVRISISMNVIAEELISKAARHVHTSDPLFIIGSTLAYVGRLQACYTGSERSTPEEAVEIKKRLQAIKLPAQYQYARKGQK